MCDQQVIVIIKLNQQQTQQLMEVVRPVNSIYINCIEEGQAGIEPGSWDEFQNCK